MADALTPAALVERLTGVLPYPWQARLLDDHLIRGEVPAALDIPTGLGKTRVMALWLAARALGARDAAGRRLPARLVYVVDRRAVVDQATEEAERLVEALPAALAALGPDGETAGWTALGLERDRELPVSTLRGQFLDNERWLEAPGSAAIVVGTVDMIGSRLLFSGYGVGRGMRPAHAGLLACDALVLLDEAHLSQPFQALLETVAAAPRPEPVPRTQVMSLSATLAGEAGHAPASLRWRSGATGGAEPASTLGGVFELSPADWETDEATRKRLFAAKRLRLEPPEGKDDDRRLAQAALDLAARGERPQRVVVFCDRRDKRDDGAGPSAQGVLDEILRLAKADKLTVDTPLLVGARRVLEREALATDLKALGFIGAAAPSAQPAVLVATSAGEVGVDLDADHMVCDLVAWERMVQRLGRVNRRGEGDAEVRVFHPPTVDPTDANPRVRLAHATRIVLDSLPSEDGAFQASPHHLRQLMQDARGDPG